MSYKVVIFEDSNFQGVSKQLDLGSYDVNSLGIKNDSLSSLKILPGIKVTLYEHGGFGGRSKIFTQDVSYVGDDFNDLASSIQVEIANDGSSDFIKKVVELTNKERSQAGLPPLKFNSQLTTAAQAHSQDMAAQDYFGHQSPDGRSPGDRISATGYQLAGWAENVYAGGSTPEKALEGWMKSPGHRANILRADMQEIGVGYYFLANDTGSVNYNHYWTQVFAIPAR
jgi:uncharacterized protein YkwD